MQDEQDIMIQILNITPRRVFDLSILVKFLLNYQMPQAIITATSIRNLISSELEK